MKNSEIGEVLKDGAIYRSTSFILRCLPSTKAEKPAFVVSKKIFKTAVLRNGARRKFKASIQPFLGQVKKQKLVVSIGQDVKTKTVKELTDELRKVFEKSGMLR